MTTGTLVELDDNCVVTHTCHEPEGDFERSIRPMPLSVDNLKKFWEQAKEYRTLFNEEIRGDFKKFIDVFLYYDARNQVQTRGLFWVLDDFAGVYYMTKIVPGVDALCHVNMLDGRFKGREEISKRLLLHAFEKYGFHKLTVQVPVYIKPNVIRFIRNLGFVSEGRLRGLVYYHDKWFDVFSFGIFKDELKLKR
ncbi:hypothetical protein LCGC14_1404650 [marine sediment metagenome]|uniref:N-acetyltransferase domain-containing protein n=1 Tax=marine sediment metagenome TaxID=412755 RepID=A0A0F9MBG8_9ZZZZ